MRKMTRQLTDVEEDIENLLKNPENKKLYDDYSRQLEISYSLLQMRKRKKMSQAQVAKKVGTTQSNIARMEAGHQNFSVNTLSKLARVFGKQLEVTFR